MRILVPKKMKQSAMDIGRIYCYMWHNAERTGPEFGMPEFFAKIYHEMFNRLKYFMHIDGLK